MPARKITTTIFKNFRRVCGLATSRPLGSLRLLGGSKTKPEPLGSGSGFLLLLRVEGGDHLGVGLLHPAEVVHRLPEGVVIAETHQRVVAVVADARHATGDNRPLLPDGGVADEAVEFVHKEADMASVSTEGIGEEVAGGEGGEVGGGHIFIFVSC